MTEPNNPLAVPKTYAERYESLQDNGWLPNQDYATCFLNSDKTEIAVVLADGAYYRGHLEAPAPTKETEGK